MPDTPAALLGLADSFLALPQWQKAIAITGLSGPAFRAVVSLYNLISNPRLSEVHRAIQAEELPSLSILIPARNEAHNLPRLLQSIVEQSSLPRRFQVLVLDDHSTDGTAEAAGPHMSTLRQYGADARIISGQPLPQGWLGKSWACNQLASQATGELLLFLDADVVLQAQAIHQLLAHWMQAPTALLSIFPQQDMETVGERITVPTMHYVLLSMLPLAVANNAPQPALAAANGQCILFEAQSYRENQWHQQARASLAEDIAIARLVKAEGLSAQVLCDGALRCRMYDGYSPAIQGFAKALLGSVNSNAWGLASLGLATVVLPLLSLAWPIWGLLLLALCVLIQRVSISIVAGQNIVLNLALHPLQMLALLQMVVTAIAGKARRNLTWKGRSVVQPD